MECIQDSLGYARPRLSVFIQIWTWSSSQNHKLITPSGTGLLVSAGRIRTLPHHLGCGKKDVPTGVNLNQYAGPGSFLRWHSDNEPLLARRILLSSFSA